MFAAETKVATAPVRPDAGSAVVNSWKQLIDPVEPFLEAVNRRLIQQVETFDPELVPYADYALNGQGKHLRPALVALAASALGKPRDAHVTIAVIIEMVHLATLVHDDVMDEAEIRRGQPTLSSKWGNDIAVLFGDCLFAQALTLAASFPTPDICRAVAMATNTVCTGEILQTQRRKDVRFTREEYFRILEMKTAELFALSCDLSASLSNANPQQRQALRSFGMNFGTAYQIYDDCLDLFGSEAAAGKSLGTDLAKGKLTLPMLLLWDLASPPERDLIRRAVDNWNPSELSRISVLLHKYKTLPASLGIMHQYLKQARQNLEILPGTDGCSRLSALTEFLALQTGALGGGTTAGL